MVTAKKTAEKSDQTSEEGVKDGKSLTAGQDFTPEGTDEFSQTLLDEFAGEKAEAAKAPGLLSGSSEDAEAK